MKTQEESFKAELIAEQNKINELKQELKSVQEQRDQLYDAKFSFESTLDAKDKAIA